MTTKETLKNILYGLYLGMQTSKVLLNQNPDSNYFAGHFDAHEFLIDHPFSFSDALILPDDYILWRYSREYWEKYSEVLNCEEE